MPQITDYKKHPNTLISLDKLFIITTAIILWVLLFLFAVLYLPSDSHISPALLLHGSSLLIVLLLIKRFGYPLKQALLINKPSVTWVVTAVTIGILYWFCDHWLMDVVFGLNTEAAIASWNKANAHYLEATVMISSVLLAPLFEEVFFRGLLFNHLSKQINIKLAAIVCALFFAAIHWSWPEFISLFTAAILYSYLLQRSQSLYIPLLAHMVHNLMTYLYFIQ